MAVLGVLPCSTAVLGVLLYAKADFDGFVWFTVSYHMLSSFRFNMGVYACFVWFSVNFLLR